MSQQKVDYHKEQKRNRRQIMAREKRIKRIEITIAVVILAAIVIWFCYLLYRNAQAKNEPVVPAVTKEMDLGAWEDYNEGLDALVNGEEEAVEETTAESAEEPAAEEPAAEEEPV